MLLSNRLQLSEILDFSHHLFFAIQTVLSLFIHLFLWSAFKIRILLKLSELSESKLEIKIPILSRQLIKLTGSRSIDWISFFFYFFEKMVFVPTFQKKKGEGENMAK